MTIDRMIEKLEFWKDQLGGQAQVFVADGDNEWGFMFNAASFRDEESETGVNCKLLIDLTGEPEE